MRSLLFPCLWTEFKVNQEFMSLVVSYLILNYKTFNAVNSISVRKSPELTILQSIGLFVSRKTIHCKIVDTSLRRYCRLLIRPLVIRSTGNYMLKCCYYYVFHKIVCYVIFNLTFQIWKGKLSSKDTTDGSINTDSVMT